MARSPLGCGVRHATPLVHCGRVTGIRYVLVRLVWSASAGVVAFAVSVGELRDKLPAARLGKAAAVSMAQEQDQEQEQEVEQTRLMDEAPAVEVQHPRRGWVKRPDQGPCRL